ncbi:MAG: hypothetical protein KW806_00040 [Candidatus Yanofskybacteria bacterium]|nr:hypothetical protein [Candidatus Yanofskybacteria bacterium]
MSWRERFSKVLQHLLPDSLATTLANLIKRRMEHSYDRWAEHPLGKQVAQWFHQAGPVVGTVTEGFMNFLVATINQIFPEHPLGEAARELANDVVPEFMARFMNGRQAVAATTRQERTFRDLIATLATTNMEAAAKLLMWFKGLSAEHRRLLIFIVTQLPVDQVVAVLNLPETERESLFEFWELQYGLAQQPKPTEAWFNACTLTGFGRRASLAAIAGTIWYLRWLGVLLLGAVALGTGLTLVMGLIGLVTTPSPILLSVYVAIFWFLLLVIALYSAPLLLLGIVFYRAFKSVRTLASLYGELLLCAILSIALILAFARVSIRLTFLLLFAGAVLTALRWRRGQSLAPAFQRWAERLVFFTLAILITGRLLLLVGQELPAISALAHEASHQTDDFFAGLREHMTDDENKPLSEEQVNLMPRRFDADFHPLVWCYERSVQDPLEQKYVCFQRRRGGKEPKYGMELWPIDAKKLIEIENRVSIREAKKQELRRQQQEAAQKIAQEQARAAAAAAQAELERIKQEEEERQKRVALTIPETPAPFEPTAPPYSDPEPEPQRVLATVTTVPAGTYLPLTLEEYLVTERVQSEHQLQATLDRPLVLEEEEILHPGTMANILVTESTPDALVLQLTQLVPRGQGIHPIQLESDPVRFVRVDNKWRIPSGVRVGPSGRELPERGRITWTINLGRPKRKPLELPLGTLVTFRTREVLRIVAQR